MDVITKILEYKLDKGSAETVRAGLLDVKQKLETQHSSALNNMYVFICFKAVYGYGL